MDLPGFGRRKDTFYYSSSNESFTLAEQLQQLVEKTFSSRFICLVHKHQNNTQLWVVC